MSDERVPHVEILVEWQAPHQNLIQNHSINSDAATTRLCDAVRAAVNFALETESGEAALTIKVNRKASKPAR